MDSFASRSEQLIAVVCLRFIIFVRRLARRTDMVTAGLKHSLSEVVCDRTVITGF